MGKGNVIQFPKYSTYRDSHLFKAHKPPSRPHCYLAIITELGHVVFTDSDGAYGVVDFRGTKQK